MRSAVSAVGALPSAIARQALIKSFPLCMASCAAARLAMATIIAITIRMRRIGSLRDHQSAFSNKDRNCALHRNATPRFALLRELNSPKWLRWTRLRNACCDGRWGAEQWLAFTRAFDDAPPNFAMRNRHVTRATL
jgi:hypothetical protein